MTFQNIKFRVENEEHSRQIQEALFKLGYSWPDGKQSVICQDAPYLFAYEDKGLTHDFGDEWFEEHHNKEGTIYDLKAMLGESIERPPLGLRPKHVVTSLRIKEILEACTRYAGAGKQIPGTWLDELLELNDRNCNV